MQDPFFDTVDFTGAIVLADKSCHGHAKGHGGQCGDRFHFLGGGSGGDGEGAEGVEGILDGKGTDRDDGRLETHGEAHMELTCPIAPVDTPVFPADMENREFFGDIENAEQAGE